MVGGRSNGREGEDRDGGWSCGSSESGGDGHGTACIDRFSDIKVVCNSIFSVICWIITIVVAICAFGAARFLQNELNDKLRPLFSSGYQYLNVLSSVVTSEKLHLRT